MNIIRTLAFFIATAAAAVGAPRQAIDPDTIKDKVHITLGQELGLKFKAEGDRLLQPTIFKGSGNDKTAVRIQLKVTDATPVPVRGVPTRPYLVVSNGFAKTLHCRALARLKGSREFFEVSDAVRPVSPGDQSLKCWESGSLVEEIVLYQFVLSKEPAQ